MNTIVIDSPVFIRLFKEVEPSPLIFNVQSAVAAVE
jgi:hypothetical protein